MNNATLCSLWKLQEFNLLTLSDNNDNNNNNNNNNNVY